MPHTAEVASQTVRWRVATALGAGMVLIAVVAGFSLWTVERVLAEARDETANHEMFVRLERIAAHLELAEAWHSRYVLSTQPADLKEFRLARDKVSRSLLELRPALLGSNRTSQLRRLTEATARKLELLQRSVDERERSGLAASAAILADPATRALKADIEATLHDLKLDETQTLLANQADTVHAAAVARATIVGGTLLSLLLVGGALLTIRRHEAVRGRMEAELRRSESQLRQITNAVPALIAYVDDRQRLVFHNKACEDMLGRTGEQMRGRTIEEMVGPAAYGKVRAHIDEVLSGYPTRFGVQLETPAGDRRDLAGHFFPRYGEGADASRVIGFFALLTDITELKRIDRMKSEFVSTVSHELRTPLTSIRGSLGLVAGGVAGAIPEAARNLVEIAKNNCERLIRLINDILDTEKIESGRMTFDLVVTELVPVIRAALEADRGFAEQHGVSLDLDCGDEDMRVRVDVDRLTQVVTNLVSNAVKFSPRGGRVVVRVRAEGSRARVEVADKGPGIPEEFRDRIFQKFSQADASDTRKKGGTGLGLNISKAIVERLGGDIGFTSQAGSGTTFFFELPMWRAAPQPAATSGAERPCVLVCEDDHDIARLIGMMVDRAGFDSEIAHDATEARAALARRRFDAMTVDVKLPGEDGIRLIRSLRDDASTRDLPILVVSAIAGEGRVQLNAEKLSVADWLQKPIDENRLVASLRDAIERRPSARPCVLHVEDDPDIQRVASAIASDFADFDFAGTLAEARSRLRHRRYDLVLLDIVLPDGSGWDLVETLERGDARTPVVVFSVNEAEAAQRGRAAAILVKARTSNGELIETIRRALRRSTAERPA